MTTQTKTKSFTTHYVFLVPSFVGHARPLINLVCNLLALRSDLKITVYFHNVQKQFIRSEIARHGIENILEDGRLVEMGAGEATDKNTIDSATEMMRCIGESAEHFAKTYESLLVSFPSLNYESDVQVDYDEVWYLQ